MEYTATFFSHFGALCFAEELSREGVACRMMPVPRALSSSCGTSVRFEDPGDPARFGGEELEAVYVRTPEGYRAVVDRR